MLSHVGWGDHDVDHLGLPLMRCWRGVCRSKEATVDQGTRPAPRRFKWLISGNMSYGVDHADRKNIHLGRWRWVIFRMCATFVYAGWRGNRGRRPLYNEQIGVGVGPRLVLSLWFGCTFGFCCCCCPGCCYCCRCYRSCVKAIATAGVNLQEAEVVQQGLDKEHQSARE